MRRRLFFAAIGILALASLAPAQNKDDRTLNVKLNYTGAGKVDESHKIFVFLFDSPEFMQGSGMPFASQAATAKDQTVTFSKVANATVYVVAAFDPTGGYDGTSGPPPAGSSITMYSKEAGKPAPLTLEPGKPVQVELAFDDSMKIQ